jgi:hypothetical protein
MGNRRFWIYTALLDFLPETVERALWQELQAFEEERKVTHVTNTERFGFERGIEQGVAQGERSLILRLLTRLV